MKTQKQTNLLSQRKLGVGNVLYDRVDAFAAANADLHPVDRPARVASLLRILRRLRTIYRLSRERHRQRRQLMEMDDRDLKDIGITREQAEQEARKPIWKG